MKPSDKDPKLSYSLVIGGGPVGAILAAHLRNSGRRTALYDVDELLLAGIRTRGIVVEGESGLHTDPPAIWKSLEQLKTTQVDAVYVAVKCNAIAHVARSLENRLKPGVSVVLLQNGLDCELPLVRILRQNPILQCIVNWGGVRAGPGRYTMTFFHKPNYISGIEGSYPAVSAVLASVMSMCGLETRAVADLAPFLWRKTILTAAIAPVTGLGGLTIESALRNSECRNLIQELVSEGVRVARAVGVNTGDRFEASALEILAGAGDHTSSMSTDLAMGRKTEIQSFNEAIAARGIQTGIRTPQHDRIIGLVHKREKNRLGPDSTELNEILKAV